MNKEKSNRRILKDAIIVSTIMYVANNIGNILAYIYKDKKEK